MTDFSIFIPLALRSEISERKDKMDKTLDLIQKEHKKEYLLTTVGNILTHDLRDKQEQLSHTIM